MVLLIKLIKNEKRRRKKLLRSRNYPTRETISDIHGGDSLRKVCQKAGDLEPAHAHAPLMMLWMLSSLSTLSQMGRVHPGGGLGVLCWSWGCRPIGKGHCSSLPYEASGRMGAWESWTLQTIPRDACHPICDSGQWTFQEPSPKQSVLPASWRKTQSLTSIQKAHYGLPW